MGSRAHIGFHAAYVVVNGVPNESGAGNALVGAYLNRIGLSDSAIIYITRAHPTEMTWLTLEQAAKSGIDVAVLPPMDDALAAKPPPPARPDRGRRSPVSRPRSWIYISHNGRKEMNRLCLTSIRRMLRVSISTAR
jgi:hypothetical protein